MPRGRTALGWKFSSTRCCWRRSACCHGSRGCAGRIYGAAAIALSVPLIGFAWRVYRQRDGAPANKAAMRMFGFTILYLFALFGLIVIERTFGLTARWGL